MAIDDNTKYAITGEQVKDLALRLATVQSKARMGDEAPTSSTEGELGQLYVVGDTIYILQDIVEESGEPTEYVWVPISGDGKTLYASDWLTDSGTVTFYKNIELTTAVTRAELTEITNTGGAGVTLLFSDPEQDPFYDVYRIIGAQNDYGSLYWTVTSATQCFILDFTSSGTQATVRYQLLNSTAGAGSSTGQVLSQYAITNLLNGRIKTNAGAPTTSTPGTKGQLLEDTTNGKLYQCTAVSGNTYTWKEVGGSGGGITTLTSADYNWPATGTKTGLAHWLLEPGIYKIDNSQGSSDFTIYLDSTTTGKVSAGTESVMVVSSYTAYNNKEHSVIEAVMTSGGYPGVWSADTRKDDPSLESNIGRVLKSSYVVDNLTSTSTVLPLSAKQGKVLNDKIAGAIKTNAGAPTTSTAGTKGQLLEDTTNGDLYICTKATSPYAWKKVASIADLTSTIKTNAGAPTTSTVGTVGQLLEDTTNGKLYICTDATNPYVWTEVGASGGDVVTLYINGPVGSSPLVIYSDSACTTAVTIGSILNGIDSGKVYQIKRVDGLNPDGAYQIFQVIAARYDGSLDDAKFGIHLYDGYGLFYARADLASATQLTVTEKIIPTDIVDTTGNSATAVMSQLGVTQLINTNAGAPTSSTEGSVGGLIEDTVNGNLYICTAVNEESGEPTTYTWEEVGAGGGGTGLTILSYGTSTYQEALAAYQANKLIYCRASSNSDPSSGDQLRMAFLAYVNNQTTPTEFEFQYYRSVSSKSAANQGDETFVYKLNQSTGWSVTKRNNYTKIVAGTGLTSTYSSGTLTINSDAPVITMQTTDPGEGAALAENHFIAVYSV